MLLRSCRLPPLSTSCWHATPKPPRALLLLLRRWGENALWQWEGRFAVVLVLRACVRAFVGGGGSIYLLIQNE